MAEAEQSILIHAPIKAVYDVVADFESYPEFQPEVKKVSLHKKGKAVLADFEVSLIKTVRYTIKLNMKPHSKIEWSFVSGDFFKDNHGGWTFEEEGKNKTRATYKIEVEVGMFIPSMVVKKLVAQNLPSMLEKFKKRIERRK